MLPRQVLPRQFYLVTRRCAQRQFLLRPDAATNNAFLYCLIAATLRSKVDVLLPCAMSNHYHAVNCDRAGRYPEFIEHFHKLLARSQNALRGRRENLWSCEQTCVVNLVDRAAVIDKLAYTASNPVADQLVDRVHHWPGINGLAALLAERPLRATRPLTRPALVTVAIYNALSIWNGFLLPLVLTQSPDQRTIPLALVEFQGQFGVNVPAIAASVTLTTLPIVLTYAIGRRQLLSGLTAGFGK